MHPDKPNVLLYGWFGEGNLGDELILSSLISIVRNAIPRATISVMASKPKQTKYYHADEYINGIVSTYVDHRPRSIVRAFKYGIGAVCCNLTSPDIVVMATGGALSDWNHDSATPIVDLINYWSARRKPIFLFGVGAGPFTKQESKGRFFSSLSKVHLITVRDEYSKKELEKLGLRNVVLTRDIVFASEGHSWIQKSKPSTVTKIGIIVAPVCRETPSIYDEYQNRITEAAKQLAEKYSVTVIPFHEEYDQLLTRKIVETDERIASISCNQNLRTTLDAVAQQDLIVGMRFHSIITALLMRKYVVPIVYHPKCYSLAEEMGLVEYVECVGNGNNWAETNINVEQLLSNIERIQSDDSYFNRLEAMLELKASVTVEVDALSACMEALDDVPRG